MLWRVGFVPMAIVVVVPSTRRAGRRPKWCFAVRSSRRAAGLWRDGNRAVSTLQGLAMQVSPSTLPVVSTWLTQTTTVSRCSLPPGDSFQASGSGCTRTT
jgi:hypothetical protein